MKRALILSLALIMLLHSCVALADAIDSEPLGMEATVAAELETEAAAIPEGETPEEAVEAPDEAPAAEEAPAAQEAPAAGLEPLPEIVYDYDELTIGTLTPFDGRFFTQMWGNNSSDLDVRMLLHGYNTVEWSDEASEFEVNPSVVSGIIVQENAQGDRSYTLTLYDDLYYSDGTKITAWDYAFSILMNIAPQVAELGGTPKRMDYLFGYRAYIAGNVPYLSGVQVRDDNTIVFMVLREHLPYFYELTMLDCVPYPIHVIAPGCEVRDDGQGIYIANADSSVEAPIFTTDLLRQTVMDPETGYLSHPSVSSGPYKLTSFDGTTAEFEINEYYKGNSHGLKPLIPRLIFKAADSSTMMKQMEQGEYGLLNRVASYNAVRDGLQLVTRGDVFAMSNYMRSGLSFVSFCCEKAPMDSQLVRQAIAHCMDKDGLIRNTVGNNGVRVDGYYGMGQWMYQLVVSSRNYPVEAPAMDADEATQAAYEAQIAEWDAVTLDNVPVYNLDIQAAIQLLEQDGWVLNRSGEPYRMSVDDVRCKEIDGQLVPLDLKLLVPEGSVLAGSMDFFFGAHLAVAGIRLTVEQRPMEEILKVYYREEERDCDMIALASNFDVVFEPSVYFQPDPEGQINHHNTTGIATDELYTLLTDLCGTASDDLLGYCRKWVAFQERFQQLEPMIPLYSNVYFDFYTRALHEYDISSNVAWSKAVVGAYMSDPQDEVEEEEEEETEDIIIEDATGMALSGDADEIEIIDG